MSRELDLQAMRLVAVLEVTGSLGAAARELGVSQPAASTCLRSFEQRWRIDVAERTPRGTSLTADGLTVAAWARDLLHQVDTVREGLDALSRRRTAHVADLGVAASLTIAEFMLPRWIGELRATMPEVHVRLDVVNSHVVDEQVRAGRSGLGFIESRRVPTDLARAVVGQDRLVLVVSPSHPWARRSTPLTRAQVLTGEFVVREPGSGTRDTFETALAAQPRVALEAASTTSLVGSVLAGIGPAVVSEHAVRPLVERGQLVQVAHPLDLTRPLTAIWRPGADQDPAVPRLLSIARRSTRHGG